MSFKNQQPGVLTPKSKLSGAGLPEKQPVSLTDNKKETLKSPLQDNNKLINEEFVLEEEMGDACKSLLLEPRKTSENNKEN